MLMRGTDGHEVVFHVYTLLLQFFPRPAFEHISSPNTTITCLLLHRCVAGAAAQTLTNANYMNGSKSLEGVKVLVAQAENTNSIRTYEREESAVNPYLLFDSSSTGVPSPRKSFPRESDDPLFAQFGLRDASLFAFTHIQVQCSIDRTTGLFMYIALHGVMELSHSLFLSPRDFHSLTSFFTGEKEDHSIISRYHIPHTLVKCSSSFLSFHTPLNTSL